MVFSARRLISGVSTTVVAFALGICLLWIQNETVKRYSKLQFFLKHEFGINHPFSSAIDHVYILWHSAADPTIKKDCVFLKTCLHEICNSNQVKLEKYRRNLRFAVRQFVETLVSFHVEGHTASLAFETRLVP